MQEFFIDYGLWLLIALLVVIGLMFLLPGRRKADQVDDAASAPPVEEMPASLVSPPSSPPPAPAPVAPMPMVPVDVEAIVPPVPEAKPEPAAAPVPVSPAVTMPSQGADDLLKLKGVGPKLNALLLELGVTSFAQIAAWTDADVAAVDARLGNFKGRPVRDQWIDQAKYLAAGDVAGFEAKYGKI
ncbi:Predicted 5' DNA nuclease, flap endonuclease-1-like, helix-3-turn-helix (H3TH) domain [Sphingobium faniae]|nr:Predicted 5' DNA nuclease, flap endonuclease-1-like, helix-3-turn-helix (H3TH) domain [Sphingobium faniae]